MNDIKHRWLLFVLLAVPSLCAGQADGYERATYGMYLAPVESFGYIQVKRYHSGRERRADEGLRVWEIDHETSTLLRQEFSTDFFNVPYQSVNSLEWAKDPAIGHLECRNWLHGDIYPIAYHVECMLGAGVEDRVLYDAELGVVSKDDADAVVKEAIDRMVARFALIFFRARGEL